MDLLACQHGVVSRSQFLEVEGVEKSAIHRARRSGWLVPMTRRTYRIRSSPESFAARCTAVSLELGDIGFLAGQTAARIHGLRQMGSMRIAVIVPHNQRPTLPEWTDIRVTSWYSATDRDRTRSDLAVASPLRMLFSLAATFNQHRFERAAEDAWHLGLVSPSQARDYLELHRCRGKDGVRRIDIWLERALPRERPAQSGLELELLDAICRVGLPRPIRQHPLTLIDGDVVHIDIAWPSIRLGVEPGAMWWHGGDDRQRRDQARDVACGEVGWQILRFDETLKREPLEVARRIRRVYRTREPVVGRI
jgi:very-short-patch-repair endonuclease